MIKFNLNNHKCNNCLYSISTIKDKNNLNCELLVPFKHKSKLMWETISRFSYNVIPHINPQEKIFKLKIYYNNKFPNVELIIHNNTSKFCVNSVIMNINKSSSYKFLKKFNIDKNKLVLLCNFLKKNKNVILYLYSKLKSFNNSNVKKILKILLDFTAIYFTSIS